MSAVLSAPSLPDIAKWRSWSADDYRAYFLSKAAAVARLTGSKDDIHTMNHMDLTSFLKPIRNLIEAKYSAPNPAISIIIRAHNEEREIIPTLVSFAMTCVPAGGAELIVVDNASTDQTANLIRAAGARCVECPTKGIGHATRAGYESCSPSAEFVFISDADVRTTVPFCGRRPFREGTVLQTSASFLRLHPKVMGVSTGMVYEATHWSYEMLKRCNRRLRNGHRVSYWSGPNQFFRKMALDAVGGINETVEYGYGEDFCRLFTVARYCKPMGYQLESGRTTEALQDPVYTSGRRFANLKLTARHLIRTVLAKRRPLAADGWPVFEAGGVVTKLEVRL